MLEPPTAAEDRCDDATRWVAAASIALERHANGADIESALAPIVAAIDALAPGWRAFIGRRADPTGVEFLGQGSALADAAVRRALAAAADQAIREGDGRLLTLQVEDGRDGELVAAPLVVTRHVCVGVLALDAREPSGDAPPEFSEPLLTLARIAGLIVEARRTGASAEMRDSLLRGVLDTVPEAVIRIDTNGRILKLNHAAEAMFGWPEAELRGENVNRLMPEPYHSAHDGYIEQYLRTGERRLKNWRRRFHGLRRNGEIFPVEIALADTEVDGERGFVGMVRDVSGRVADEARNHALREQVEEASRLSVLGEMAATIAHEVNQPLTALGNYLDAAAARLSADAPAEEVLALLEKAREMGALGGEVVRRVKQLTRRGPIERSRLHVNDLLEESLVHLDPAAARIGAVIKRDFARGLPAIDADRVQVQQIVTNLVRNALEAVEDAAERVVTVATEVDACSQMVRIGVIDTGPGPPRTETEDIFDSFVTTRREGLGLGLAISKRIAEAHGGRLRLETIESGGAAARVELPFRERIDD